jgi:integrase
MAMPEHKEWAIKYWDDTQVRTFLTATADDMDAMVWRLLLASGLRIGEALALRWVDVDLNAGEIRVRRTLSAVPGGFVAAPPKTKAGRRAIPLDGVTTKALKLHRQTIRELSMLHRDIWVDGDLVFPREDGKFRLASKLRDRLNVLCPLHGVLSVGLHGLRPTHATLLLAAGIAPKVVSERLGHTTVTMTMDTYSHVTRAMQEQAAQAIGAALA